NRGAVEILFLNLIATLRMRAALISSQLHTIRPSMSSTYFATFGEILVDMIWSVDAQLDEVLSDAKAAQTVYAKQEATNNVASVRKIEQNVEKDKDTVQFVVKRFLSDSTQELGIIDASLCRERLDSAILASVGLIPDKVAMDKKEIRTRTGLFYKQNKFNLLREQSEGYSKLTSELTSSLGPSHSPLTGRPTEPYSAIEERARPVWEKVISLIGYFDLDPNRALDLILDVLSVHLTTHYTFFIALLSFSPWVGSVRIAATTVSQLAMAAPLESSGTQSSKNKVSPVEVKKPSEAKDDNQKVGLVNALLSVGALKPALSILSKFPFLVDARPEIADLIIRIMKVSISPLYESLLVTKERNPSYTQPRARYGSSGVAAPPTRKPVLSLWAPTPPSTYNTDFVFFYPDWTEEVPLCSSLSDLEDVIEPLMKYIGVHVSRDPMFLTKFLRLGRAHLQTTVPLDPITKKPTGEPDNDHPIRLFWFKVLRVYLLRALTLIRGNAVCTVEVWNIIRQYSTTSRWRLYGEWKSKMYESHPELQVRQFQAKSETKAILRRLSSNSNDTLSGTVAKLAHSNPCVFFDRAVHQIMSYDNLAHVVIQALRYVTNMGFDVLVYVIVDAFSDPSRPRSQVTAMAGGPVLRIESIASATRGARLDPGDAVLKGPWRLGKTLLDSSLALSLLIQVAQQRQACVFKAPDTHLKSLGSLYDTTHGVLLQYLELLTSVIPLADYADKVLPSLGDLGVVYGICAPICLQIIRPVLQASLLKSALVMQEQERKANEDAEKRLKAALTAKREPVTSRVASPSPSSNLESHAEVKTTPDDHPVQEDVSMDAEMGAAPPESPWIPELAALFDDIKKIAPGSAFEIIGPGFYLTFWQLSTYDLSPPTNKYDEECATLLQLSRQEESRWRSADHSSDRVKRATAISHKQRRERYIKTHQELLEELKNQTASRAFTLKRLSREKQHWFSHGKWRPKAGTLAGSIIEHCIQPRCLLSPMDADFCAQFIKVLHTMGTPGFHTLNCYDKLLGDHVKVVLFSCSEYEAHNYGRFLSGILSDMFKWYSDEAAYMMDNRTKVGGKNVYNPGLQRTWFNKSVTLDSLLDWPSFQRILRKWHKKLAKCFIDCIQTGEFMHVYNTIIILKELLPVFPLAAVSITDTGASLDAAMDRFLENEERGDLKILGKAYSAALKKRESLWAMPKKPLPHPTSTATSSPKPTNPSHQNEKPRGGPPPSGPSSIVGSMSDGRRNATPISNITPSAPRAQLANGSVPTNEKTANNSISSAKAAMDSIPRPEVVKRIRANDKQSQSPKPPELSVLPTDGVKSSVPAHLNEHLVPGKEDALPRSRYNSPSHNGTAMPPPSAPSQTPSAQELRESARQSIRTDKLEAVRNVGGSGAPSPRIRSPSPSSRPGTRNHSSESRASGGRSRPERVAGDGEREERRSDRDGRQETREAVSRRDSVTHTPRNERAGRERTSAREAEKDSDRDKDRDRPRDRHDRDKDRDRDREPDRRDRERDRERDRDRDRHRRDEKDRDREGRKDREQPRSQNNTPLTPSDDRGLPTRPDARHRPVTTDDGLGKRRRPADDDVSAQVLGGFSGLLRGLNPSLIEVLSAPREKTATVKIVVVELLLKKKHRTDVTRTDAEETVKAQVTIRAFQPAMDKRPITDGHPAPSVVSGPNSKPLPPSGPRAMFHDNTPARGPKTDPPPTSRDRHRDYPSSGHTPHLDQGPPPTLGSLHSRIGDKEPPRSLPQHPNSYRPDRSERSERSERSDSQLQRKEDDRDNRKRTISDRDKDVGEPPAPNTANEVQPPKRPRINRTRYTGGSAPGVAKKLGLPIDPAAGDKAQRRRD
ncbi:hypothetical protein H0H93_001864, partial [Arthromyces matolae]